MSGLPEDWEVLSPQTSLPGAADDPKPKLEAPPRQPPGSPEQQELQLYASPPVQGAFPGGLDPGGPWPATPDETVLPFEPEERGLLACALATPLGASSLLTESVLSADSAGSVRLRLVSEEEHDALQASLRELEKRASLKESELAGARARLESAEEALMETAKESNNLRRVAIVACSICAFLGLKALVRGGSGGAPVPKAAIARGPEQAQQALAGPLPPQVFHIYGSLNMNGARLVLPGSALLGVEGQLQGNFLELQAAAPCTAVPQ